MIELPIGDPGSFDRRVRKIGAWRLSNRESARPASSCFTMFKLFGENWAEEVITPGALDVRRYSPQKKAKIIARAKEEIAARANDKKRDRPALNAYRAAGVPLTKARWLLRNIPVGSSVYAPLFFDGLTFKTVDRFAAIFDAEARARDHNMALIVATLRSLADNAGYTVIPALALSNETWKLYALDGNAYETALARLFADKVIEQFEVDGSAFVAWSALLKAERELSTFLTKARSEQVALSPKAVRLA